MILNVLLFIAGLLVYGSYGLWGFVYLLGAVALAYAMGLLIPKHKWLLWVGVALNALWLLLVKLTPVTGFSILAPMGISYFTLRLIAYMVDVSKEEYPPERNIFRFGLTMTYLPHLFLGPIEPYGNMADALFQNRKVTWEGIGDGLVRLAWGGFKKLIISARLSVIVGAISADPATYNGAFALAAMLLYSLQLYTDFSGGMDMVLGISRMLGVRLSENFRAPYLSQSVREFWKRWHITLGAWLMKYVYIPLGGNRKGKVRKVINLLITFLVSGIWHGVEYLLWGLGNGIAVAFGDKLKTKCRLLNQIGTYLLISLLWAFFIWPTAALAGKMLLSVATTFNYGTFIKTIGTLGLTAGDWIVLGAALLVLALWDVLEEKGKAFWKPLRPWVKTAIVGVLALLVALFGMYGIGFNAESFIYSRF